jgi:triosephosphate isomerase
MPAVLDRQIAQGLAGVPTDDVAELIVAYEPVWAIGTGKTATAAQADQAQAFIRGRIGAKDRAVAENLPILYGGSVKAANAAEVCAMPYVDGGLVGGASLVAEEFVAIWRAAVAR